MFKSMICLFLTTSFLILNIKPGQGQLSGEATIPTSPEELVRAASLDADTEPALMETAAMFVEPVIFNSTAINDAMVDEVFFVQEQSFLINLMAIMCLIVTVLNMFFEA